MNSELKVPESFLYEIWQKQNYKETLKTSNGEEIEILDCGSHNNEIGGPDFKNARIRIGNLTYVGDIEIDRDYSDWKTHGHNIDNKYNSVILHTSLFNKNHHAYVYTRNGRKVPSICLYRFIDNSLLANFKNNHENEKDEVPAKLKCADMNHAVPFEVKEKFLLALGIERFNKKCKRIYDRLKELEFLRQLQIKEPVIRYELTAQFREKQFKHSDFSNKEIWQQLLYELIFEALGYSKNKIPMNHLAQSANINFMKKINYDEAIIEKYEAVFLYISGLIKPDFNTNDKVIKDYLDKIAAYWNLFKNNYDNEFLEETQWHFFRLRPQNFPTIRIAAGARYLKEILFGNMINTLVKKITEIHNLTVLINSLRSLFVIKSDGFWKNHYVFDQPANSEIKYFVGIARSDEIVVNVVLPFFAVYFEMFGNNNLVKKILKIYTVYQQRSENQIITEIGNILNLKEQINRTVLSQGIIDLFRNYCSKNKCLECEIGKSVFN